MKLSLISTGILASVSAVSAGLINLGSGDCSFSLSTKIANLVHLGHAEGNAGVCSVGQEGVGIIAGIFSFSTKTTDILKVVNLYQQTASYAGEFDQLMPVLQKCAETASGTLVGLDGFCESWTKAAANKDFITSQLKVAEGKYQDPVSAIVSKLEIVHPITQAILYDTAIVDGLSNVPGVLDSIISATNLKFTKDVLGTSGNTLLINGLKIDELEWVKTLLDVRQGLGIAKDVGTINIYRNLLNNGLINLGPVLDIVDAVGSLVTLNCSPLIDL
ncbi:hypothetical protein IWW36_003489 [Coemansia brasiliensis]|uniref:Uncharacterized protein n=1 Tax=Coemansia brasiliensis TaxID=2650707 RepID=A0A9W8LYX7_9FUNG|nr:hypothetical protein IWW36_003489 [Coemansia brasiliensis]